MFLFENLLSNEYKGNYFVIADKKIFKKLSSKLLGCIQSRLDKLFPRFITVYLDKDRMVHAVFDNKLFLSDDTMSVIKEQVREILF